MAYSDLQGKNIVITGASSGFGKGAALEFSRHGANVVLAARRDELLEKIAADIEAGGGRALAVPTDVASQGDMEKLAEAAISAFGRIDVWINNAGAGALGRFEEVPLDAHVRVIEIDLLGVVYGSYLALNQFRRQGAGILINVASVLGKVPAPYYASYAAAKHGVVGLSACLRQELAENDVQDIHVCTVMPTSMDTPFFDHVANYTGHEPQPLPPLYDPQEVIDTLVRLATDPEEEVTVGGAGKAMVFSHHLAPDLTEKMIGKQTQKTQMEKAPSAPDTPGNLEEPEAVGASVHGGRLD